MLLTTGQQDRHTTFNLRKRHTMIQDIFPHNFDNHFKPDVEPDDEDILFCFEKEAVLCRIDGKDVFFPHVKDLGVNTGLTYLFELDGEHFFLTSEKNQNINGNYEYVLLLSLRKKDAACKPLIFAAITARHLNDWYESSVFCGCCGRKTEHSKRERAMVCPYCGKVYYPRINPAVIVGVTDGDNILLTKYAGRNLPFYALVAGFTEIGESLEETVKREVMEETGLEVTNIRYYKSQPWGFSGSILSGYFCDVSKNNAIHMDTNELKEAVWMPRGDVPGQPDDFSLTNEMMLAFRDGHV